MAGARCLPLPNIGKPQFAVIGEPTDFRPIFAHKGFMMLSIALQGSSGHSSDPDLGHNALDAMHCVMGELLAFRAQLAAAHRNTALRRVGADTEPRLPARRRQSEPHLRSRRSADRLAAVARHGHRRDHLGARNPPRAVGRSTRHHDHDDAGIATGVAVRHAERRQARAHLGAIVGNHGRHRRVRHRRSVPAGARHGDRDLRTRQHRSGTPARRISGCRPHPARRRRADATDRRSLRALQPCRYNGDFRSGCHDRLDPIRALVPRLDAVYQHAPAQNLRHPVGRRCDRARQHHAHRARPRVVVGARRARRARTRRAAADRRGRCRGGSRAAVSRPPPHHRPGDDRTGCESAVARVRVRIEGLFSMGLPNTPLHNTKIHVLSGNLVTARPFGVIDGVDHLFTGRVRRIHSERIHQC